LFKSNAHMQNSHRCDQEARRRHCTMYVMLAGEIKASGQGTVPMFVFSV
jgi:hypothetical protein